MLINKDSQNKKNNIGMTDKEVVVPVEKRTGGDVAIRNAETPKEVVRIRSGVDRMFLITVLLLVFFGSIMVFSAGYVYSGTEYGDSFYLIKRQIGFVFIGLLAMIFAMRLPPMIYKKRCGPHTLELSSFLCSL